MAGQVLVPSHPGQIDRVALEDACEDDGHVGCNGETHRHPDGDPETPEAVGKDAEIEGQQRDFGEHQDGEVEGLVYVKVLRVDCLSETGIVFTGRVKVAMDKPYMQYLGQVVEFYHPQVFSKSQIRH